MTNFSPYSSSSRPALAFFAPSSRMAEAKTLSARCYEQGWLVSCHPLARAAIAEAFVQGRAVVGWCAPAILVRAVPWTDKRRDSPVLCFPPVSDERAVLLALSGWHHGGRVVARALQRAWREGKVETDAEEKEQGEGERLFVVGGSATEEALGFSLEDPPQGWSVQGDADGVLKALAREEKFPCQVVGEACGGFPPQRLFDLASKASKRVQEQKFGIKKRIAVGFRRQREGADLRLVPRCVTVGVGCVRGASMEEIAELVDACFAEADIEAASVAGIASVSLKRTERGLLQFAERRGFPLRFFSSQRLSCEVARHALSQEEVVERATGTPNVAEAAALALAVAPKKEGVEEGAGARLLLGKRKSTKVTCALAVAPCALPASMLAGERNGVLTLVGLGPGRASERTAAAARALREAEGVVGYEGYVALLEEGETRAELFRSAIGSEELRARHALALAREGKNTVLLGSGDAGVYGLAALVWQILAEESHEKSHEKSHELSSAKVPVEFPVEVRQVSGVSAMHALAARLGAPLGDDFCAISLSDVMTREKTIVQRIEAAAKGDFVVALYNPQSRLRRALLPRALALLRAHRPPDAPVAFGRNIGRKDECVKVASLQDVQDVDADSVDMHTLVVVGNSKTKRYDSPYGARLYTERGYRLKGG